MDPSLHFAGANMFRELSRLFEVATELANHASATSGATVVDVQTRIDMLRHHGRRPAAVRDVREPMVDVFNEDDHYLLVAELRGVDRENVHWRVNDGRVVVIDAVSPPQIYYREIELGTAVDPQTAVASFDNGVLELRLWKL
jgi:HSP20 family molecular chaperone IbpA